MVFNAPWRVKVEESSSKTFEKLCVLCPFPKNSPTLWKIICFNNIQCLANVFTLLLTFFNMFTRYLIGVSYNRPTPSTGKCLNVRKKTFFDHDFCPVFLGEKSKRKVKFSQTIWKGLRTSVLKAFQK